MNRMKLAAVVVLLLAWTLAAPDAAAQYPKPGPGVGGGGLVAATDAEGALPDGFRLEAAYPNPFNPRTTLPFVLEGRAMVRLQVFDLQGRLVRTLLDGMREPGAYAPVWDGRSDAGTSAPTGTYLVRLQVGDAAQARPVVLLK